MGQGRTYLNIKGATPWETGYSTRSSDNDNAKDPGKDNKNPDGSNGDNNKIGNEPASNLGDKIKKQDVNSLGNNVESSLGGEKWQMVGGKGDYPTIELNPKINITNGIPSGATESKPFSVIQPTKK